MPYTEEQSARYTNQIVAAVRYLHSKHVCHRDLKFENIMFESSAEDAMVILIDFGLSKAYKPGQAMSETVGARPGVGLCLSGCFVTDKEPSHGFGRKSIS
jgi:serine/threonine protein kinase